MDDGIGCFSAGFESTRTAGNYMIRTYCLYAFWIFFAADIALGQAQQEPESAKPVERSLWNGILSPATKSLESKVDSNQLIAQAFKFAQVLAIPLIDATKSISQNLADASDSLDPFGMKEAHRTIRWQQEVINDQQKELLKWQQNEIERLQAELDRLSKNATIEKESAIKKDRKTKKKKPTAEGNQSAN